MDWLTNASTVGEKFALMFAEELTAPGGPAPAAKRQNPAYRLTHSPQLCKNRAA